MKIVELKTTQVENGGNFVYKDVLTHTLKTHPQGMGIEEMERVLRILGTVRQANGRVVLEDVDHEYVVKRLTGTQWTVADAAIVQFVKDVREAPALDANALLQEKK